MKQVDVLFNFVKNEINPFFHEQENYNQQEQWIYLFML